MTLPETLAALHAASFDRGWSAQEFESLLANPAYRIVAADHGFALLQLLPPEAELITISVLPSARGQGHGRRLLSEVIATAQTNGATTLLLDVDATNEKALRLYKAAGFEEFARRAGYYGTDDQSQSDAIQMALRLPAQSSGN